MERNKYIITLSDDNQFEVFAYGFYSAVQKANHIVKVDYAGCEIISIALSFD